MAFEESLELLQYTDLLYTGASASIPANIFILKKEEAVKNAIKMYLFSSLGDYGRDLTKGGPLVPFIGKPLDDSTKSSLESTILKVLSRYSNILVNNITVQADKANRRWKIQIVFSDTYNKFTSVLGSTLTV